MLDYACIFTTGGVVLWCKAFCDQSFKYDIVNMFIKNVLLDDKTINKHSYSFQDNVLRWKIIPDLKIVFAIVYKEILQLTMIDDLLDMLKFDFQQKVWPKLSINGGVVATIPPQYLTRFQDIMLAWEKNKQEQTNVNRSGSNVGGKTVHKMRTFDQSRKSKKTLKKEAKKAAQAQEDSSFSTDTEEEEADGPPTIVDVATARKTMKQRMSIRKKSINVPTEPVKDYDSDEEEREYQRKRQAMAGPKRRVTIVDMAAIDVSTKEKNNEQDMIDAKKAEFLGDEDEDLRHLGFLEDDDKIDFSNFKIGKTAKNDENVEEEVQGIFGKLTSAFQNYTGNKTLTATDVQPILKEFSDGLTNKNVSAEIAQEICKQVKSSLIGVKTASFTSISQTIQEALVDSIEQILTPKRNIDILKEALAAKKKGQVYSIVFIGVNGVGKSTSLAKTAYYLKTKGNLKVMVAGCDNFRSGAIEQLQTHCSCLDIPLYQQGYKNDAAVIAKEALIEARNKKYDVVLIDTAGRMQGNEALMKALAKLVHINKPDTVLFVGEALVGNDSIDQLTKFNQSLIDFAVQDSNPRVIDGIIMTKFDTVDDKVGTAINMVYSTGKPIVFVGIGQKYPHLKKLNVQTVVQALMQ